MCKKKKKGGGKKGLRPPSNIKHKCKIKIKTLKKRILCSCYDNKINNLSILGWAWREKNKPRSRQISVMKQAGDMGLRDGEHYMGQGCCSWYE